MMVIRVYEWNSENVSFSLKNFSVAQQTLLVSWGGGGRWRVFPRIIGCQRWQSGGPELGVKPFTLTVDEKPKPATLPEEFAWQD